MTRPALGARVPGAKTIDVEKFEVPIGGIIAVLPWPLGCSYRCAAVGRFGKPKLLIIDELGYLPFEPNAAHLFFQLVSRRYERGSVLITSNRSIGEWGAVFGDAVVATAILDRLLHHSHVITIRGDSYRLREKRRSGLLKAPIIAQSVPVPA